MNNKIINNWPEFLCRHEIHHVSEKISKKDSKFEFN